MPEKYYCCYKTFNFSENFNVFFLSMVSIFNLGSLATKTYRQLKLLIQDGGKFIVTSISSRDDMSTQTIQSLIDLHLQLVFFFLLTNLQLVFFFVDKPSTCFLFCCWQTFNLFSILLTNLQLAFFLLLTNLQLLQTFAQEGLSHTDLCSPQLSPGRSCLQSWSKIKFSVIRKP